MSDAPVVVKSLVMNVPEWFKDPAFIEWLNGPTPKFTWHKGGKPTEWSDVVVLVDPGLSGAGTDTEMPEHIWDLIVEACRAAGFASEPAHIPVRLTNLEG